MMDDLHRVCVEAIAGQVNPQMACLTCQHRAPRRPKGNR
jgi:hypothetical protein